MDRPGLFTTPEDIARIKEYLKEYDWYRKAYENIKKDVDEMLQRGFEVPSEKGYVFYTHCRRDGAKLLFDPYSEEIICPACGMRYTEENYVRARLCSYHHWLSQMAVLAGIVYLVSGEERYAAAVREILLGYVKQYPGYENNDNELGTTKTFQSTYMESVWITYLAGAYDMVRGCSVFDGEEKKRIVKEFFLASAEVIRDYDEGDNNRQAFNNCGLCAVALISGDEELLRYALYGPHGFVYHMSHSILEDGMWYEGDNYHFATVPSIVNIAEMCLGYGINFYEQEFDGHRIRDLFAAPLVSLQPDLTFPSRKDSPYQTRISQRWYAGLYEVAYRRCREGQFGQILERMYAQKSFKEGSLHNAAGVMDSFEADVADRERMDWRGFLNASPELVQAEIQSGEKSVTMKGTGLSIIRQADGTYCSLDYGHYGGGHGHPDRLQISLFARGRRWLTDYGTGQYYFDHLKWYRSTLGHNTVVADERDQKRSEGTELIFDENREFTIVEAGVKEVYSGIDMKRTLVKFRGGPLFDYVEMISDTVHTYDYMLHSTGVLSTNQEKECERFVGRDGAYTFLEDVKSYEAEGALRAVFQREDAGLIIRMPELSGARLYTAKSYGSPYRITERFPLFGVRQSAESCCFAAVMEDVEKGEAEQVTSFRSVSEHEYALAFGEKEYRIQRRPDGWDIRAKLTNCEAKACSGKTGEEGTEETVFSYQECISQKTENSDGNVLKETGTQARVVAKEVESFRKLYDSAWTPNLLLNRADQIIRAEAHWDGPDVLSAEGRVSVIGGELVLEMKVRDHTPQYLGGKFIWDNDSIQLYFRRKDGALYQFLILPKTEDGCADILDTSEGKNCSVKCAGVSSAIREDGYEVLVSLPFEVIGGRPEHQETLGFDVIVNDRDTGVRRDRQMIWSGARGLRTYLREAAHPGETYGILQIESSSR